MDLYLSDLHLGSPLFDSEEEIVTLIKDERFDRIYFVGDMLDVWEEEFTKIQTQYQLLIATINDIIRKDKKEVKIVKGNHDPDESIFKYLFPQARVYSEKIIEGDVIIVHGNEFDGAILKIEWMNKLLYYLLIWPIQRFFSYNIRDNFRVMLSSVASRKGKPHYKRLVSQIEKDAVEKYQQGFNHVVMGHTHFPKIVNCDDNTCHCEYINCGDWIFNKSYVIRDDEGIFHLEGDIRG